MFVPFAGIPEVAKDSHVPVGAVQRLEATVTGLEKYHKDVMRNMIVLAGMKRERIVDDAKEALIREQLEYGRDVQERQQELDREAGLLLDRLRGKSTARETGEMGKGRQETERERVAKKLGMLRYSAGMELRSYEVYAARTIASYKKRLQVEKEQHGSSAPVWGTTAPQRSSGQSDERVATSPQGRPQGQYHWDRPEEPREGHARPNPPTSPRRSGPNLSTHLDTGPPYIKRTKYDHPHKFTVACKFWSKGMCRAGDECTFRHG
jgi:hypothetical protein